MPLKLSKCLQANVKRSTASSPHPNNPLPSPPTHFQNSLSFRLHHRLNHPKNPFQESPNKQLIRKFYGKKVVYLESHKDIKPALHKSRLFRSVSIKGGASGQINFKCQGDLVILGSLLNYKELRGTTAGSRFLMYFSQESPINSLVLKKLMKNSSQIAGNMRLGLGPLRFMLGLKQISLDVQTRSDIEKLAKASLNFRRLENLKLRYVDPNYIMASSGAQSCSGKKARCLFSRMNQLPRLKDFKLETSHRTIENYFSDVQGDLNNVVSKKNLNMKMHVKLYFAWDFLGNKKSQALGYFLRDAEALKIDCGGDAGMNVSPCKNKEYCLEERQENNKRNTVEILSHFGCKEVNLKEVLSYCEFLETLHIKSARDEIAWKSGFLREVSRLEKLQNVMLDFSILKLDSQIPSLEEKRHKNDEVKFKTPLLSMLHFFRENCHTLQDISLFLCLAKIDNQARLSEFLKEIKGNKAIKKFELCTGDNFNLISPQDLLPFPQNLESFGVYSSSLSEEQEDKENLPPQSIEWDNVLPKSGEISPKHAHKSAPVSSKFLSIDSVESPKILRIFNTNHQNLTFDFVCNLLQEVIENNKHMKKLIICTDIARKRNCIQNSEKYSGIQGWQKRIEDLLKSSNLEEVLIGKMNDFPADFVCYSKEFNSERIFWSEEQISTELMYGCKLEKMYSHFLKMVNPVFDNKTTLKKYSL